MITVLHTACALALPNTMSALPLLAMSPACAAHLCVHFGGKLSKLIECNKPVSCNASSIHPTSHKTHEGGYARGIDPLLDLLRLALPRPSMQ